MRFTRHLRASIAALLLLVGCMIFAKPAAADHPGSGCVSSGDRYTVAIVNGEVWVCECDYAPSGHFICYWDYIGIQGGSQELDFRRLHSLTKNGITWDAVSKGRLEYFPNGTLKAAADICVTPNGWPIAPRGLETRVILYKWLGSFWSPVSDTGWTYSTSYAWSRTPTINYGVVSPGWYFAATSAAFFVTGTESWPGWINTGQYYAPGGGLAAARADGPTAASPGTPPPVPSVESLNLPRPPAVGV